MGKVKHLHKKIEGIEEHFISLQRIFDGEYRNQFAITIGVPSHWYIPDDETLAIEILSETEDMKVVSFTSRNDEIKIDDIFSYIEFYIKKNKEIEKKELEYQKKLNEMKEKLHQTKADVLPKPDKPKQETPPSPPPSPDRKLKEGKMPRKPKIIVAEDDRDNE